MGGDGDSLERMKSRLCSILLILQKINELGGRQTEAALLLWLPVKRRFCQSASKYCGPNDTGLSRGQYPDAIGREEEWLAERMARHALPRYSHEQHLAGDRWVRVEERRTADEGSIGVRIDITNLKRRKASSPGRRLNRVSGPREIKRAALEPPFRFDRDRRQSRLTLDDVNDLVGMRTKNDIPAANQDELVSTPFRINFHDV